LTNKDKLLEAAQKFLAKGQLSKAVGEYQKLVEAFPKDYRIRQRLAELLSRDKRNDEAQPHYEAVAKNFLETGFYLKAIAIYKQMQKIEPGRVDLCLRLAELNEKQGLIGNALNEYRTLVAFYDKNHMARESVGVLQKMIAMEPENLGVRGKLIETLAAVDEDNAAFEQFRTLVRLLADKGEHGKVVKLYEKFLDLCPDDVDCRLPLAAALLASGQADKALALLKGLLKQAPDHVALLTVLTDSHLALGNHADARLTCQHLLKEQPRDIDLCERYVRICIAGADYERALDSLEEAKENFSSADRVGLLRELYESLQDALPDNPRLQATLTAIYEATVEDGLRPAFASAARPAMADEETADAAILDAAIGDVEPLDMVGEAVEPVSEGPPLGTLAAPTESAKPKGRPVLELDLDLDLEPLVAVAPPTAAVPEPTPQSSATPVAATPAPAAELEMELEIDFGGLDGLVAELPASSAEPATAIPKPTVEPEPAIEPAAAALPEMEPPFPVLAKMAELPDEDGVEPKVVVAEADEATGPLTVAGGEGDTCVIEAASEEILASADATIGWGDQFVESEHLEELEAVEELDEVEEIESLDEVETLDGGELLEELEELEELEDLENIVEEQEPEPLGVAAFSVQQLRDELDQAEFYLRQGLFDEAEREVLGLQVRCGVLPELTEKLAEIDVQRQSAAASGEAGELFDLTSELKDEELLGATDFLGEMSAGDVDEFSLESSTEDNEDAQSHFDLGIAYKEMGLLDDAIAEFGKASRDPSRLLDCLTLKGQCQAERGEIDKAEATFKEVLGLSSLTDDLRVALRYELGLLYENSGRPLEALECFHIVADQDLFFREVTDKLKALRQTLGLDDDLVEPETPHSNRDRISFV
jgi:tetratricopeptide (TPR) repeat protein